MPAARELAKEAETHIASYTCGAGRVTCSMGVFQAISPKHFCLSRLKSLCKP